MTSTLRIASTLSLALSTILGVPPSMASPAVNAGPEKYHNTVQDVIETPRFDVRAMCPSIDESLQKSLGHAWNSVEETGVIDVKFKLDGNRITEIAPTGGPRGYWRYIRRALFDTKCVTLAGVPQLFAFRIKVVEPSDRPGNEQFVLLND